MNKRGVLLGAVLMLVAGAWGGADSLWQPSSESLFADRKARNVGDILTVLIVESSSAKHAAQSETKKELETTGGPGAGLLDFFPSLSLSTERSATGSGSYVETTSLVDRVSVVVREVLPNGVLRVEGERDVYVYPEHLRVMLRGLVRTQDISPDNTVSSTRVADLRISSRGRGPVAETHRPGLIARLLHLLW